MCLAGRTAIATPARYQVGPARIHYALIPLPIRWSRQSDAIRFGNPGVHCQPDDTIAQLPAGGSCGRSAGRSCERWPPFDARGKGTGWAAGCDAGTGRPRLQCGSESGQPCTGGARGRAIATAPPGSLQTCYCFPPPPSAIGPNGAEMKAFLLRFATTNWQRDPVARSHRPRAISFAVAKSIAWPT